MPRRSRSRKGEDGALYVGTGPNGRVVRFAPGGTRTTYYETGQKYVWALAFVGKTLYAATGSARAAVSRSRAPGKGRVVLDAQGRAPVGARDRRQGHAVRRRVGPRHRVRVDRTGHARALFEAPEKEIRALAWDGHALYAAAMSAAPITIDDAGPRSRRRARASARWSTGSCPTPRRPRTGCRRRGSSTRSLPRDGKVWAATGSRAALYRVDARGKGDALWAGSEGQVHRARDRARAAELLARDLEPVAALSRAHRRAARAPRSRRRSTPSASRAGAGCGPTATRRARTSRRAAATPPSPDSTWSDVGGRPARRPRRVAVRALAAVEARAAGLERGRASARVTVAWGEVNQAPAHRRLHGLPGARQVLRGRAQRAPRPDHAGTARRPPRAVQRRRARARPQRRRAAAVGAGHPPAGVEGERPERRRPGLPPDRAARRARARGRRSRAASRTRSTRGTRRAGPTAATRCASIATDEDENPPGRGARGRGHRRAGRARPLAAGVRRGLEARLDGTARS